ncbi:MAG: helix-hairpin-helix domain-containing protein [Solibacillus sp.]
MFFIIQPFLKKYGKRFIAPIAVCLVIFFYFFSGEEPASTVHFIDPVMEEVAEEIVAIEEEPTILPVVVDVKGAVLYPGVYELTEHERIVDAITMAGGYADGAEPKLINHAQKLQDEMVIYIPKKGEQLEEDVPQLVQVAGSSGSSSAGGKINLNKATEAELTTLPGVGPAKATAIIGYRNETGKFQTIEDLKNVSGIGDKTFEQLRDLIDVK